MSNKNDNLSDVRKCAIAGQTFKNFLKKYEVSKNETKTHYAFGEPWGSFNIPDEAENEFFDVYCNGLQNGVQMHMIEKPKEVGPLLVDIDFHYNQQNVDERIYKQDDVTYIIGNINKLIMNYYKWTEKNLFAFVFEKNKPTIKKDDDGDIIDYKDGFHLVYPYIGVSEKMRYLILHELKQKVEKENGFGHIDFTNTYTEVFDMGIIRNNGWLMYGSMKDKGQPYFLTHIYSYTFDEKNIKEYKHRELVRILSNRKYKDNEEQTLKETINTKELDAKIDNVLKIYGVRKEGVKSKKNTVNNSIINNKFKDDDIMDDQNDDNDIDIDCLTDVSGDEDGSDISDSDSEVEYGDAEVESIRKEILKNRKQNTKLEKEYNLLKDINLAKKLVEVLSVKRATEYNDWIRVGWALHNISPTLLPTYKSFSKKAGAKYDEKGCDKVWTRARDDGLGISSLRCWAKLDNFKKYSYIISSSVYELLKEAETGTEFDISKVVFELYKDQYKCTSLTHDTWYEFQEHRWVPIDKGYTLNQKLSEEVTKEFALLNSRHMKKIGRQDESVSGGDLMTGSNVMKIMLKLKTGFKDKIMKECQRRFYDPKFEEKLDSNRHLIGFNNGIYDLELGCFRPGSPDDYVSFTVGYDYEEYGNDHEYIKELDKFFSSVQREKDMKEYILKLMASYLDGFTKSEQFVIWTGSGGNGKSKAVELFQLAFGEYCEVVPITLLTQKRKGSSQASPEVAKLRGKRFVVFQEPENTDEIQVGYMKELTGGDWIYARPLFKDPIRFKPQFKLLLTCNKLPYIPSTDGGTWRRLRVSPWESEFVDDPKKPNQFKKDYDLTEKLNTWKKAFLWYLLKVWYPRFKKEGLKEPAKVTQFTNNYKKDSDIFFEFLDNSVEFTKNDTHCIDHSELYASMKYWYNDAYTGRCPYNKKQLVKYLNDNNYSVKDGFLYGARFKMDNKDVKQQNELDD